MISKFQPESEFVTEERCYNIELFNKEMDEGCSIARARVEPGYTTQVSFSTFLQAAQRIHDN